MEKHNLTILVSNYTPCYSSEVLMHTTQDLGNVRFKLVVENGNSYFNANIYILNKNNEWALIATKGDINNIESINYFWNEEKRIEVAQKNMVWLKQWTLKVFPHIDG